MLMRTLLRLCAVETLLGDPVLAHLCGPRIFDSRMSEINTSEATPIIVLRTGDETASAYSVNSGGVPFDSKCELVLELTIGDVARDADGALGLSIPYTDATLEALLDLMQQRALDALTVGYGRYGLGDWPARLRQFVTRRATSYQSVAYSSDELGGRIAQRFVTLSVELKTEGDDALAGLAPHFTSGSYAAQIVAQLIEFLALDTAEPHSFGGVDIHLGLRHTGDSLPDLSDPQTPQVIIAANPD